ncbi:MAG: dual specificity protein phosphatase family protein [Anaerolineae bacterium]|nr:dual specificity protein phosphatase family protein [Anaerolineae bacterium]
MEQEVYYTQTKLSRFPVVQFFYVFYRRLLEHGIPATILWVYDKVARRVIGYSPTAVSRIQPYLYVGGQQYRHGLEKMRAEGITAVVNMRSESDDAQRGVALDHNLWLPTVDNTDPTLDDLKRGAAFIAEHIAAGRGVYIHCASGIGRAPTMAAAYLISTGLESQAAWDIIREHRPFIRPTPPQVALIRKLDQKIFQKAN